MLQIRDSEKNDRKTKGKGKEDNLSNSFQTLSTYYIRFCGYLIVLITLITQTFLPLPLTNQSVILLIMETILSAFSIVLVYHTLYASFKNLSILVDLLRKSQMWAYGPRSFHHYSTVDSQKLRMKIVLNPIMNPLNYHFLRCFTSILVELSTHILTLLKSVLTLSRTDQSCFEQPFLS